MAGRTPAEALRNYKGPLQQAIAVISRSAVLIDDCHNPADGEEHYVTFAKNEPIRVAAIRGDAHYRMMFHQRFRLIEENDPERGPWRATTKKYEYVILDDNEHELLAYHWHLGEQAFNEPHLHVEASTPLISRRAHLPTARVPLEDFVLLLIRELGIAVTNQGYRRILENSKRRFLKYRNW